MAPPGVVVTGQFLDGAGWPLDGTDRVLSDEALAFVADLQKLLAPLLPRYQGEGKSYLTIALGCTGGKHRSVFLAELIGCWLCRRGWDATTVHRDLARATAAQAPA